MNHLGMFPGLDFSERWENGPFEKLGFA